MKLTFLGTGTSQGVPVIGCRCAVCMSADPRDCRLRTSAMVETQGRRIVIDAGPDFRYQMLRSGVRHLDAILLTHEHKDHIGGLDDESFAAMEDTYLFGLDGVGKHQLTIGQKGKKAVAVVLIVVGLYMLWNVIFEILRGFFGWDNPILKAVYYIMRDDIPRAVLGIAVIWFGMVLLRGKKTVDRQTEENRVKQIEQQDNVNMYEK